MAAGWEIVCPDGRVRYPPYHNEGDARCDAAECTEGGCRRAVLGRLARAQSPCPEGQHDVRRVSFDDANPAAAVAKHLPS